MAEKNKQIQFPPTYTRDVTDIQRLKHAAIDAGLNFSEYQHRAIMQRVNEDEVRQQQVEIKTRREQIKKDEAQG